jgi:hypothetical protein
MVTIRASPASPDDFFNSLLMDGANSQTDIHQKTGMHRGHLRLRTHKQDSLFGRFVIQSLRRETIDGSKLFLAERTTIRAA